MDKRRTIAVLGSVALAGVLALAVFSSAFAQTQPGNGPGGMMGGSGYWTRHDGTRANDRAGPAAQLAG